MNLDSHNDSLPKQLLKAKGMFNGFLEKGYSVEQIYEDLKDKSSTFRLIVQIMAYIKNKPDLSSYIRVAEHRINMDLDSRYKNFPLELTKAKELVASFIDNNYSLEQIYEELKDMSSMFRSMIQTVTHYTDKPELLETIKDVDIRINNDNVYEFYELLHSFDYEAVAQYVEEMSKQNKIELRGYIINTPKDKWHEREERVLGYYSEKAKRMIDTSLAGIKLDKDKVRELYKNPELNELIAQGGGESRKLSKSHISVNERIIKDIITRLEGKEAAMILKTNLLSEGATIKWPNRDKGEDTKYVL